jgi:hypothetical protein
MAARRWLAGLWCAAVTAGLASEASAQQIAPTDPQPIKAESRFGVIRVRIDPQVGDQDAEIRQLLAAHTFVRIAEPADYLITTKPDFPLDITLVDLRQPREQWGFDEDFSSTTPEPRSFAIGNLRSEDTAERLGRMLVAAARIRALLDHSFGDMQGLEACLLIKQPETTGEFSGSNPEKPTDCRTLGGPGPNILHSSQVAGLRVQNTSNGDRYVSTLAAGGGLRMGWFGMQDHPPVTKLAPGESVEFQPVIAGGWGYVDDPRILLLVSGRPFAVDGLTQPAPLNPTESCRYGQSVESCDPATSAIALSEDFAVRSFQLLVDPELRPMIGQGSDVTAAMAVWMAQFYSILPYTQAEIDADALLPEDERQYLSIRNYAERQHRCGATLIGPNLVLTAAHCVAKGQYAGDGLAKVFKDRRVRLGTRNLGKGGQSFAIAGVAVHGGYIPGRQNHDVALLLIKHDRDSGAYRQQPIAIADRPLPGGVDALAFGWGLTGAVAPDGNILMSVDQRLQRNPEVLQYGELRSVTLDQCRRKLAGHVAPGMVCMYSRATLEGAASADGVFTCRGDSGGPLVRKVAGRDVLVGVVNWSMGCGFKDYPSVFADVGSYAAWVAAARAALRPGMAIRVADPARPVTRPRRN